MTRALTLAGAALVAAFAFGGPASAAGNLPGTGPAATANEPSTVGLSAMEGRSGWRHRHWGPRYGWRPHWRHGWGRHYGWRHRHWRRHW